ncbi:MAG TPA: polymer-forming cytoskeletal protein [Tepidiformaceae bacterium]|nr:polymer-forming cytoskeletal protein [Tepidiformaceae bacterium]
MQLKKNPRDAQYDDLRDESGDERSLDIDDRDTGDDRITRNRTSDFTENRSNTRGSSGESVIDAHSTFDGRFETEQDMRVLGTISGEVVCRGQFTVEQDATARSKVEAHDAVIRGRLEGDIVCSGRLLLANTAVISGTMKAATLVVEEGANVAGNVETTVAPLARVTPVSSSRSGGEAAPAPAARTEKEVSPAAAAAATRTGRAAPSFAFVPSDERRSAGDR